MAAQWSTLQMARHYTDGVPEVCFELPDLLLRYETRRDETYRMAQGAT